MNYDELSREIQRLAGGGDNVVSHTNCMTRLRLDLLDPSKVDAAAIRALDGVLGVVEGEQMQIIVGLYPRYYLPSRRILTCRTEF